VSDLLSKLYRCLTSPSVSVCVFNVTEAVLVLDSFKSYQGGDFKKLVMITLIASVGLYFAGSDEQFAIDCVF